MRPVTLWTMITKDGARFNHLQDGHVEGDYPLPLKPEYKQQRSWAKGKWIKEHAYLNDKWVVVRGDSR